VEKTVDDQRLMAGSPIEADDVFMKNRPAPAEGVADPHASEQP
jgi:hypothetical protein